MNTSDRSSLTLCEFADAQDVPLLVNYMHCDAVYCSGVIYIERLCLWIHTNIRTSSKNKERGGYIVEMGGTAERNVTDDLLLTYTTRVNHSLFTINIH